MSGLETAIKSALERSDRTNAELRARIYHSARQALESGLRKQNITDPEVIEDQRHRLETMIHEIEQQERARLAVTEPSVDEIAAAAFSFDPDEPEPRDVPDVDSVRPPPAQTTAGDLDDAFGGLRAERGYAETTPQPRPEPAAELRSEPRGEPRERSGSGLDIRPEQVIRQRKRRGGLLSRLFILLVLLASAGMGAWWVYTSGVLLTDAERDTSVPNPPPRAEEEDFLGQPQPTLGSPDTQQGFSDDWMPVFEPTQVASLQPRANASVDIVGTGDDQAVRILSRSGDEDGSVSIAFPVEVLREMAGKTSTIALALKSDGDQAVQVSVECDFDRLGECARHRFTVNPERGDILFRVTFDRSIAPNTPGSLIVNADLAGTGKGVDLYEVRVLPGR
ncbi:hypothetical protein M8R20_01190 [Pseudomonas sp. R2.Fl]|nr:hypothetical protein [Pseudomonas sp. R2.Fl]